MLYFQNWMGNLLFSSPQFMAKLSVTEVWLAGDRKRVILFYGNPPSITLLYVPDTQIVLLDNYWRKYFRQSWLRGQVQWIIVSISGVIASQGNKYGNHNKTNKFPAQYLYTMNWDVMKKEHFFSRIFFPQLFIKSMYHVERKIKSYWKYCAKKCYFLEPP